MITEVVGVIGAIGSVFDRWKKLNDTKIEREVLLKLLYIESRRNLALLDAIRLDGEEQDDADYLSVAEELETAILEHYLMGKEDSRGALAKFVGVLTFADEPLSEPPKDTLMSIYVRITALQKICRLPMKGTVLKNIRYRTRLQNLKSSLVELVKFLGQELGKDAGG